MTRFAVFNDEEGTIDVLPAAMVRPSSTHQFPVTDDPSFPPFDTPEFPDPDFQPAEQQFTGDFDFAPFKVFAPGSPDHDDGADFDVSDQPAVPFGHPEAVFVDPDEEFPFDDAPDFGDDATRPTTPFFEPVDGIEILDTAEGGVDETHATLRRSEVVQEPGRLLCL